MKTEKLVKIRLELKLAEERIQAVKSRLSEEMLADFKTYLTVAEIQLESLETLQVIDLSLYYKYGDKVFAGVNVLIDKINSDIDGRLDNKSPKTVLDFKNSFEHVKSFKHKLFNQKNSKQSRKDDKNAKN